MEVCVGSGTDRPAGREETMYEEGVLVHLGRGSESRVGCITEFDDMDGDIALESREGGEGDGEVRVLGASRRA